MGQLQIAGVPERHEPDSGEVNYAYLVGVIDGLAHACGWNDWIGCECKARKGRELGGISARLGWLRS